MIDKIAEIRKAVNNETYIAALALALTLPDICAQVENGKKTNRIEYIKWFDKYIDVEDFQSDFPGFENQKFDGKMCYALRCKILHCGNADVTDKKQNINIDRFILVKPSALKNNGNEYGYTYKETFNVTKELLTYIRIDYICERLCDAAEKFYNQWTNKKDFDDYKLDLIDIV